MLNPEQIKELRSKAGLSPTLPSANTPNPVDIIAKRKAAIGVEAPTSVQPSFKASIGGAETILPNVAKTIGNIPSDVASVVESAVINPAKNIGESIKTAQDIYKDRGLIGGTEDIVKGTAETAADIFKAPGKALMERANKMDVLDALSPLQESALKQRDSILEKIQEAKKAGKDTSHLAKALKYTMETLDSMNAQIGTKEERTNKEIEDYTSAAKYPIEHPVQTAIAVEGAGQTLGIEDPIHSIANPIVQGTKDVVNPIVSNVKQGIENVYSKQEKEIFSKPTTVAKPAYNRATEIANNGKGNPSETLVKNGVKTSDIIDGKVYNTSDTADMLRSEAGKMSNETLRPTLEQASYSTPKTSVDDIVDAAIKDLKGSKGITPGDMKTQIAKIKAEGEVLAEKYPDGMNLADMHNNRITYSMNGKYSPINDPIVNNTANVNRTLGKALDSVVTENIPTELKPIYEEFQQEMARQFQAADYLDALHGKPIPRTVLQNIMKTTAKVAGAGAGNAMGGGIIGGVGGYHLGGMIESAFENMSNPVKSYFLNNLKNTNPEAFEQIKNYISQRELAKLMTPQLPAPSYREMGAPKPKPVNEKVNIIPAKKNPVSVNPKTGKFQKTYSSTP